MEPGTGLFVDGTWAEGPGRLPVADKYTGDVIAELHVPGPGQVDAAIASAARAGDPLPSGERAAILRRAARLLDEERDTVVARYVAETGFTPADATTELDRTLLIFELCAQEALRLTGEMVPVQAAAGHDDSICFTMRVPVGVVAAITPFNAPLSTVAHKIAPALAAGNAVVLKPAEQTPLCSIVLVRSLLEAGLPERLVQLLPGPGETVGDQLVRHPDVRYITFTGSTAVGRHIRAVSGLARTQLELGSNSPTLLWRDADLEHALPLIVRAGYRKAGQVCTSVQRLLVHEAIADEVTSRLTALVHGIPYGDPRAPGTQVGPLISTAAAQRAETLVGDAVGHGSRLLTGGTRAGAMIAPALLAGLPENARLASEEAFAPVLAIAPIGSIDEAARMANAGRYGLQAGVFCQDLDVAFTFTRRLEMGGVIINDTSSCHPDPMPYGGVKDSGQGVEGPGYAVPDMTESRTILIRHRPPSLD
ncbi:aldehyde dehydrogenase family protein [Streptomyces sp. NBC_00243]|uniref:aldehyde dehydrogenase family protein n=1 Tax=Streptomyces sp. NBC_00243 TaxID=2975688 RepID=UPI002DD93012|nr:aldehyde dehydrogenase family protein [Streptomyces sp. NBC_00243]WRZ18172.1 aldehyde dehydrogenase family protein [Streptomyces sp. NBC_00243]